jgi:hypothetical protein
VGLILSIEKNCDYILVSALHRERLKLIANRKEREKKMSKKNKVMAVKVFGISTMVAVTFGWVAIIKMAFIG